MRYHFTPKGMVVIKKIITGVDKDVEKLEISYNACVNEKGQAALKSSLEASTKG